MSNSSPNSIYVRNAIGSLTINYAIIKTTIIISINVHMAIASAPAFTLRKMPFCFGWHWYCTAARPVLGPHQATPAVWLSVSLLFYNREPRHEAITMKILLNNRFRVSFIQNAVLFLVITWWSLNSMTTTWTQVSQQSLHYSALGRAWQQTAIK